MKLPPFFVVFFFSAVVVVHGQTADELTLKNIIESETQSFTQMSFADVAKKFWLLDQKTRALVTISDGTQIFANQDDMLANNSTPPPGHATFLKTNFRFVVNGNLASASYDQVVTITETGDKLYSKELHIFQKVADVWKIHLSSVHQYVP